jgi:uncharacterized protein YrrD
VSVVIRATGLIGRPVVTLDTATDVAEVKDVVFDPAQARVVGFTLRGRGALGAPSVGVLPTDGIVAIGRDAITIADATVVHGEAPDIEAARSDRRDVLGDEVLTESGSRIGTVVDLVLSVEGARAEVAGYEIVADDGTKSLIPIPTPLAVSGETLMVPDGTQHFVADDLTGFGAAIESFRTEAGGGSR